MFCDVKNTFGGQRNYRFYGDSLPDGTPCGWDKYCLNGECLVSRYFWKDCLKTVDKSLWPEAFLKKSEKSERRRHPGNKMLKRKKTKTNKNHVYNSNSNTKLRTNKTLNNNRSYNNYTQLNKKSKSYNKDPLMKKKVVKHKRYKLRTTTTNNPPSFDPTDQITPYDQQHTATYDPKRAVIQNLVLMYKNKPLLPEVYQHRRYLWARMLHLYNPEAEFNSFL